MSVSSRARRPVLCSGHGEAEHGAFALGTDQSEGGTSRVAELELRFSAVELGLAGLGIRHDRDKVEARRDKDPRCEREAATSEHDVRIAVDDPVTGDAPGQPPSAGPREPITPRRKGRDAGEVAGSPVAGGSPEHPRLLIIDHRPRLQHRTTHGAIRRDEPQVELIAEQLGHQIRTADFGRRHSHLLHGVGIEISRHLLHNGPRARASDQH